MTECAGEMAFLDVDTEVFTLSTSHRPHERTPRIAFSFTFGSGLSFLSQKRPVTEILEFHVTFRAIEEHTNVIVTRRSKSAFVICHPMAGLKLQQLVLTGIFESANQRIGGLLVFLNNV